MKALFSRPNTSVGYIPLQAALLYPNMYSPEEKLAWKGLAQGILSLDSLQESSKFRFADDLTCEFSVTHYDRTEPLSAEDAATLQASLQAWGQHVDAYHASVGVLRRYQPSETIPKLELQAGDRRFHYTRPSTNVAFSRGKAAMTGSYDHTPEELEALESIAANVGQSDRFYLAYDFLVSRDGLQADLIVRPDPAKREEEVSLATFFDRIISIDSRYYRSVGITFASVNN